MLDTRFGYLLRQFCYFLLKIMNQNGGKWRSRPAIWAFDDLSHKITCFGILEESALNLIKQETAKRDVEYRGTFLDIGANIGNHAIFFANNFEKIFCFEPEKRNFSLLEINTQEFDNITCFNLAVSAKAGTGVIVNSDLNNSGKGYISVTKKKSECEGIIEVCSLDTLPNLYGVKVDVIKLDVEGHELQVLKGAQKMISSSKPLILFELNAQFGISEKDNPLPLLEELGYLEFYTVSNYLDPLFDFRRKYEFLRYPAFVLEAFLVLVVGQPKAKLRKFDLNAYKARTYPLIIASTKEIIWG